MRIKNVRGREILDSRGNPTIEVYCELEDEFKNVFNAIASVPSGASTGKYEAFELRDGNKERYAGFGVLHAIKNINAEIRSEIIEKEFSQKSLDDFLIKLDGTENKSRLGGNAMLGVSLSFARAFSLSKKIELYEYLGSLTENTNYKLPKVMLNVINGGKHADSGLDIQEFMLIPYEFQTMTESIRAGREIIYILKKMLINEGYTISVGDEGGFAPRLSSNDQAFEILVKAIEGAGYAGKIKIGIDSAASSFFEDEKYKIHYDGKIQNIDTDQMINWYKKLSEKYPLMSIEDGLDEDDWKGFNNLMINLGDKNLIVGDDLTVTNPKRIKMAIDRRAVNAIIIKLNQIGTLSETIQAIKIAKEGGLATIVSHRSGETNDTFIADLSVGMGVDYIKSGSLIRGERVCKYNRLLEIEDKLTDLSI